MPNGTATYSHPHLSTYTGNNMPFPLAAAIGAIGSIASTGLSNRGAKKRQRQADKYNRQSWERQNKYNHPLQQMERLKSAGLNPNMIYGNSPGSAVGNAGAQQHASKAAPYSMENPIIPGFQAGQLQAQTNNLKTLSTFNDAKTLTELEKADLTGTQAKVAKSNMINDILARDLDVKRSTELYVQEQLKTKAMSNEKSGHIARYAAETQKAIAEGNVAESKTHVEALNAKLAKAGIRPNDPLAWRIWSLVSGVDLNDAEAVRKWAQDIGAKIENPNKTWTPEWKGDWVPSDPYYRY